MPSAVGRYVALFLAKRLPKLRIGGITLPCVTPSGSCAGESAYLLTEAIVGEWTDRSLPSELKLSELMVGALELSPGR